MLNVLGGEGLLMIKLCAQVVSTNWPRRGMPKGKGDGKHVSAALLEPLLWFVGLLLWL